MCSSQETVFRYFIKVKKALFEIQGTCQRFFQKKIKHAYEFSILNDVLV